jgi:DNA-binding response OmpR family regulator
MASRDNREVILIAERDRHVRELQEFFLTKAGFAVEFAEDGEMALDTARRLMPRAVVCEILLPKLDGLTLCRRLKADPSTNGIAVIVFSILSAGIRAHEAGADAFLRKPIIESTFLATIRDTAAGKHLTLMEHQK